MVSARACSRSPRSPSRCPRRARRPPQLAREQVDEHADVEREEEFAECAGLPCGLHPTGGMMWKLSSSQRPAAMADANHSQRRSSSPEPSSAQNARSVDFNGGIAAAYPSVNRTTSPSSNRSPVTGSGGCAARRAARATSCGPTPPARRPAVIAASNASRYVVRADPMSSGSRRCAAASSSGAASLPWFDANAICARTRSTRARREASSGPLLGRSQQRPGRVERTRLDLGLGGVQRASSPIARIGRQLGRAFQERCRPRRVHREPVPGRRSARAHPPPPRRAASPRGRDATRDDRDRQRGRSPRPAPYGPAGGPATPPPGRPRRGRADDGNALGPRTRPAPPPRPAPRHRLQSRALGPRSTARSCRRPGRRPRSGGVVGCRSEATQAVAESSARCGWPAAGRRDGRSRPPDPP